MSYLLNSGQVGILDKSRNSNFYIHERWKNTRLLEGLDVEVSMKVALSYEIVANILLMEQKMIDIHFKNTGESIDEDARFDTVLFPVVRRTIAMIPEAHEYVPEIVNMLKKEYNTTMCRAIYSGNENAIAYFYDKVLPVWSSYHKDRKHETYQEYKREMYEKRNERGFVRDKHISYEDYMPMDWEAEFAACVADKIAITIREHIKNKENGTDKI